jgi:hypothetical protein
VNGADVGLLSLVGAGGFGLAAGGSVLAAGGFGLAAGGFGLAACGSVLGARRRPAAASGPASLTLSSVSYTWSCSRCGAVHEGLPLSWAFDAPIYWQWLEPDERQTRGFCNADICVMTDDAGDPARFVRGTIDIPIVDATDPAEDNFVIGVWASLSEESFVEVVEIQDRDDGSEAGPWFGWLSNRIRVYPDTLNLQTHVHYRPGLRPVIEIRHGDHPLAQEASGITFARARELAERWYHASDAS